MKKLAIKSFHTKNPTAPSLKKAGFFVLGITVMFAMILAPRANAQDHDKAKDLAGDRISFTAFNPDNGVNYVFNGKIEGDHLTDKMQIHDSNNKSIKN